MGSLLLAKGGALEQFPLIHVQDRKDAGVTAGWGDATAPVGIDLNYIQYNSLDATLTSGVSSGTALGFVGISNAPINNPANGTHNEDCYVTLDAGKYYVEYYLEAGYQSGGSETQSVVRNLTDNFDIYHSKAEWRSHPSNGDVSNKAVFDLDGTKDIGIRFYIMNNRTEGIENLGNDGGSGNIKKVYCELKIYKIG